MQNTSEPRKVLHWLSLPPVLPVHLTITGLLLADRIGWDNIWCIAIYFVLTVKWTVQLSRFGTTKVTSLEEI